MKFKPQGRDSREALGRQLSQGRVTLLGAERERRLIGAVMVSHDGRKGWINRLAVDPAYRRQGLGARLIAAAEKELHGRGVEVIAALIGAENEPSLNLFQKEGICSPERSSILASGQVRRDERICAWGDCPEQSSRLPSGGGMRKGELLVRLAEERANLLRAIEGLEEGEMTLPGVEGEWSVKDLLGHIAAWEREARLVAQKIAEEDAPRFDYQIDPSDEWREWNTREVERRRGLLLSDILEELTAEHEKFKEMVERLSEEQLSRKAISPWDWETTVEEQIRVQYQHEREHTKSILEWRKRRG